MISLLRSLSVARAVTPAPAPVPVTAVVCQRALTFSQPYRWRWSADHPNVVDVTALVVRADAELLRTRDVGQRVLYVEGWPAEVLWTEGGRALVLAPLALPDTGARVWFGDEALPETVGAAERVTALRAAAGIALARPEVRGPALTWGASRRELVAVLRAWAEGCSPAE